MRSAVQTTGGHPPVVPPQWAAARALKLPPPPCTRSSGRLVVDGSLKIAQMSEDQAPQAEAPAVEAAPAPAKPVARIKKPVRPDDTEVKTQIAALQESSESGM